MAWEEDILGAEFQSLTFEAKGPDGVERTATLVRFRPAPGRAAVPQRTRQPVLFLHGWSDYFFNVDLARFWNSAGYDFYALDMHNHGRSLRPGAPGGFVSHLADYDAEIEAALLIIGGGDPPGPITLMGHSTGGLVAALWAAENPGSVSRLVLNSPWLEMHGSSLVRRAASGLMAPMARLRPTAVLRLPERGYYWRTISSTAEGEWSIDDRYRPPMAFPVRAGWLSAVLAGHARVARGLNIQVPILVLLSAGSATGLLWSEAMRRTDAVLDVNVIGARALALGRSVTVERIEGALHDVFLSPAEVRADAYARMARWLRAYGAGEPPGWAAASTAPP